LAAGFSVRFDVSQGTLSAGRLVGADNGVGSTDGFGFVLLAVAGAGWAFTFTKEAGASLAGLGFALDRAEAFFLADFSDLRAALEFDFVLERDGLRLATGLSVLPEVHVTTFATITKE